MWAIGERLRERRKQSGYSAKDVAGELNISKSYISMLESGDSRPNWELLGSLVAMYKTSADYILGLTDDPGPREIDPDEAVLLAGIRAMNKYDQVAVRTLLATLPKEAPEQRRFTLEVIARLLLPAKPHIIGEEPNDDAQTDPESA